METKPTQSDKVDVYMKALEHPLKEVMQAVREIVKSSSKNVGEEVKWNAPTFFYAGPMKPSDPKKYKRYLAVSNLFRKEFIMLVLPHGAQADDGSGFLEGDYADGRRLVKFYSLDDVDSKKKELQAVIKLPVKTMGE